MNKPLLTLAVCAALLFSTNSFADVPASTFAEAAASLENPNIAYISDYVSINYPLGDVDADKGVCSDVIIRAYRLIGIDLQQLVHEDMKAHFNLYPKIWGLTRPDTNIDHRRVPNLRVFFKRKGISLPVTRDPQNYLPGDLVTWNLRDDGGSLPHIGIVVNQRSADNQRPLIIHNIGGGQVIEDILFDYKITGHYRYGVE
jgi:hypothetical protein